MFVKFIKKFILKILVKETKLMNIEEYPNYDELNYMGVVKIVTDNEVFFFHVKYDKLIECKERHMFFFKCKRYTVELEPLHDEDAFYKDKIMLAIKANIFRVTDKYILGFLIDTYLDKFHEYKQRLEK